MEETFQGQYFGEFSGIKCDGFKRFLRGGGLRVSVWILIHPRLQVSARYLGHPVTFSYRETDRQTHKQLSIYHTVTSVSSAQLKTSKCETKVNQLCCKQVKQSEECIKDVCTKQLST